MTGTHTRHHVCVPVVMDTHTMASKEQLRYQTFHRQGAFYPDTANKKMNGEVRMFLMF